MEGKKKRGRGEKKKAEHMLFRRGEKRGWTQASALASINMSREAHVARDRRAAGVPPQNRLNLLSGVVFPTWRRRSFHVPPMRSIWRYGDEDGCSGEGEERCERAGSAVSAAPVSAGLHPLPGTLNHGNFGKINFIDFTKKNGFLQ